MSAAAPRRVVICGGGVVGTCTAYFLATHAMSPTVPTLVEKCAPACAASGKTGGFLALDWCDSTPALSRLTRASFALHCRLADALGGADAYGFRPVHTLSILLPSHPASTSAPHPLLPPSVNPSASAAPSRELSTPDTTAQVHSGLFTKVLAASGAEVVIDEVERVVTREGRVTGIVVKGRDGVAVVLALGPWSGRLEVVSEVFDVSRLKAHNIVLRSRELDKITSHCLFLIYQSEPGPKMLDPEVYPWPTSTPLLLATSLGRCTYVG